MVGAMKHNTPPSSDRVENSEQEKTRILVPTLESGPKYALPGSFDTVEQWEENETRIVLVTEENGPKCALPAIKEETRLQFHLVDLKSNKVHLHFIPSLLRYTEVSSAVAIDDSIYIFGGPASEDQKLDLLRPLHHDTVFIGASRYDLTSDQTQTNVWCPAPVPTKNLIQPVFVSLGDKIYGFGKNYLEPEVLDPTVGQSKALYLPCDLVGCKLSNYPLPDPFNRRVLMHLSDGRLPSPSIYAFTPNHDSTGGNWECIAVDFQNGNWTNAAAVVDNVIYFYEPSFPDFVRAFDLASETWLEICWKSKFKEVCDMSRNIVFDAMIPLGDRILCFAAWELVTPGARNSCSSKVEFFKFKVDQSGNTVTLSPLESYSYVLPDTRQVTVFLPV